MTAARSWPRVIGHRGAAASAPENTLAGFRKAAALGVERIECDVRLTREGRVILLHDDTLDRTTTGHGPAAALSFEAIRRCDAGAWFGADFRGERVPSLEEAIDLWGELGLGAVIELKPAPGAAAATGRAAAAIVAARWPAALPPPLLSSFEPEALAAARATAPQLERALLVRAVPRDWQQKLATLQCTMLHADQRKLRPPIVAAIHAEGVPLFAFTVNLPERARQLYAWGVTAVFSDCPERIAAGLETRAI